MINHARTLLMNVDGTGRHGLGVFGEEYIPEDFKSISAPQSVINLRRILYGRSPESVFMNYRTWELLRILHSTEFVSYVTDLDSRITYDLDDRRMYDTAFGATLQTISAVAGVTPSVLGEYVADEFNGRAHDVWDVKIGTDLVLTVTGRRELMRVYTVTGGLSERYTLPGSSLEVRFVDEGPAAYGGWWRVEALAKPTGFSELEGRIRQAGSETFITLFSGEEPYASFKNLWDKHSLFNYRMSGLLLAMIYRMEERRGSG